MSETKDVTAGTEQYNATPQLNALVLDDEAPEELTEMFQTLREEGIVTIEGDVCCSNCAASAAACHADGLEAEGETPTGTAHYHEQNLNEEVGRLPDEEDFATYDIEYLRVGFGGNGDTTDAEVAGLIMEAAYDAGLDPEWNGSTGRKIRVNL